MTKKVYLAGKMAGLTLEEQIGWRNELSHKLEQFDMKCLSPADFYSYFNKFHKTEREILLWELHQLKTSDLVIVNLKDVETSVGTIVEIATAYNAGVPILGYGDPENHHPWVSEMLWRTEEDIDDLVQYVGAYFSV